MDTTNQLNAPEMAPQVGGQLYVYQLLTSSSNAKITPNLQIFLFP